MNPQQMSYEIARLHLDDLLQSRCGDEALLKRLHGFVRARRLKELATASSLFEPEYHTGFDLRNLLQVEAFFKKNAAFVSSDECSAAALASFLDAERSCRITNRRLSWYYQHLGRLDPAMRRYLERMEVWIDETLGPWESFLGEIPRRLRLTDGATYATPRSKSVPFLKLQRVIDTTEGAIPLIRATADLFGYRGPRLRVCQENRVEFVPKNWKTHRTIACEPTGTLPYQLAFDSFAKDKLRRRRINLSDQSRNQRYARDASQSDKYSTLDLSAASDTVSYDVVAWLFPVPFFDYLDRIRAPRYKCGSLTGEYAKFSSMGNGSTFVIETLIFAAACAAVGSRDYTVYGDDIIITRQHSGELIRLLKFLGFKVNADKSHTSGPYHESCGEHWFNGSSVTPFFIRGEFGKKPDLCHLVNGLAEIAVPGGGLWRYLVTLVKEQRLPLVPFNESSTSGVFIDIPTSYATKALRYDRKMHRLIFSGFISKGRDLHIFDSRTLFLWYLDAYRIPAPKVLKEARIRSRITLSTHKFKRSRVSWFAPARATPLHLYWWTEHLTANT